MKHIALLRTQTIKTKLCWTKNLHIQLMRWLSHAHFPPNSVTINYSPYGEENPLRLPLRAQYLFGVHFCVLLATYQLVGKYADF